eukprot:gb/GEZN01007419.1/.p1 GENE.gb/GEZN01007419.1/~~gb/GEZN01007419.1/.p1  ORF type:complete len:477 (+),score=40.27 gb/GEZN01007419.1/:46-1476(+)
MTTLWKLRPILVRHANGHPSFPRLWTFPLLSPRCFSSAYSPRSDVDMPSPNAMNRDANTYSQILAALDDVGPHFTPQDTVNKLIEMSALRRAELKTTEAYTPSKLRNYPQFQLLLTLMEDSLDSLGTTIANIFLAMSDLEIVLPSQLQEKMRSVMLDEVQNFSIVDLFFCFIACPNLSKDPMAEKKIICQMKRLMADRVMADGIMAEKKLASDVKRMLPDRNGAVDKSNNLLMVDSKAYQVPVWLLCRSFIVIHSMGTRDDGLVTVLVQAITPHVPDLGPNEIAIVFKALAKLEFWDDRLVKDLESQTRLHINSFQSKELASVMLSASILGINNGVFYSSLKTRMLVIINRVGVTDLLVLLEAMANLEMEDAKFVKNVALRFLKICEETKEPLAKGFVFGSLKAWHALNFRIDIPLFPAIALQIEKLARNLCLLNELVSAREILVERIVDFDTSRIDKMIERKRMERVDSTQGLRD